MQSVLVKPQDACFDIESFDLHRDVVEAAWVNGSP